MLILIWEPQQLFMTGFQLSFCVVFSIAMFALPLQERIQNRLQPDPTQRFSAAFASASVNATAPCGPWHPGCDQGTGAGRGCIAEGTGYIQAVEVEAGVVSPAMVPPPSHRGLTPTVAANSCC